MCMCSIGPGWQGVGGRHQACYHYIPLALRTLFSSMSFLSHWFLGSLLGRKVMTNLDSILKSRDITLPTKVHLVKALVFPVVMYGCESWTVKKAER